MDPSPDQLAEARAYEALFVPSLMAPFAPVVADAAGIAPGAHVLDVACGTGVVAREAARRAGASGRVIGLDANPGMLAVAREQSPAIGWELGRAEALPFPDGSFDAVVSQFGLMFFTDPRAALSEILTRPADQSRGRHNPRAVKRKMSNFPTRARAQPILPPRQRLIYADHILIETH